MMPREEPARKSVRQPFQADCYFFMSGGERDIRFLHVRLESLTYVINLRRISLIRSAIPDVFRNASTHSTFRIEVERVPFRDALKYGRLPLVSRYLLSPLAGFTTLPFRRIVRRIGGVGLATTDLVNSRALLSRNDRTMQMVETHPEDRPFAVQIFGSEPDVMADAARMLYEHVMAANEPSSCFARWLTGI